MRANGFDSYDSLDTVDLDAGQAAHLKPGLTFLVPLSLICWVLTAFVYWQSFSLECESVILNGVIAGISCFGVALIVLVKPHAPLLFLVFACLGVLLGSYGALQRSIASSWDDDAIEFEHARVVSDSDIYENCCYTIIDCDANSGFPMRAKLITDAHESFFAGEVLSGSATVKEIKEEDAHDLWMRGIDTQLRSHDIAVVHDDSFISSIYAFRKSTIERLQSKSSDECSLIEALACGYREDIKANGLYDKFKTCGLAHIVAVSGAHLSIISVLLVTLCAFMRIGKKPSIVITASSLLIYLVFAGLPISGIRAACMSLLSMLALITKRRAATLHALSIMILVFIITDPTSSVSVSLFLSVASTLGIVMFAPLVSSWLAFLPQRSSVFVREPLALTVSSHMLCQPASCALFAQLPLVSPLANIIVAPLFLLSCVASLVCALSTMAPCFIFDPLLSIACFALLPIKGAVCLLSSLPYASIPLSVDLISMLGLSASIACALWIAWPQLKTIGKIVPAISCVVLCMSFIGASYGSSQDVIVMLDVGQGDAFLVKSEGHCILIDTGNKETKLREGLAKQGVTRLDAVLITHPDDDHCGALVDLATYVVISNVWVSDELTACGCSKCERLIDAIDTSVGKDRIIDIDRGDIMRIGKFTLTALWPDSFIDHGGNADSLSMLCAYDEDGDGEEEYSALFTGDAEKEQLEKMIDAEHLDTIDIIKVGHHGSKVALSDKALSQLNPKIALISVGKDNRYGHPAKATTELLDGFGIASYRTDESGCVEISYHENALYANGETVVERMRA